MRVRLFNQSHPIRNVAGVILSTVVLVAVSACGGTKGGATSTTTEGPPQDGGILRVVHNAHVSSLDPAKSNSGFDQTVLFSLYDRLFNFDFTTMQATPGLAESSSWTTPTTLQLKLRQNVKFQDGTPFNAAAVKFSLDRGMTTSGSIQAPDLTSVKSIDVVDDSTVNIVLKQPNSALPLILSDRAGMMVSPTAVQKYGDDFGNHPVGTGPFMFKDGVYDEYVNLVRFDGYWGGKPHLDGISWTVIADPQAAANALQDGQQDFIDTLNVATYDKLKNVPGIASVVAETVALQNCAVRAGSGPLSNVLVRQALEYSIDRDAINKVVNEGLGKPVQGLVPPSSWAFDPSNTAYSYTYDPDKSKQLLAQAGVTVPVHIQIAHNTSPDWLSIGSMLKEQLAKGGFDAETLPVDPAASTADFGKAGKYDMLCKNWTGRPDPSQVFNVKIMPGGQDVGAPYTPPADVVAAVQATTSATADADRKAAFSALEKLVVQKYALSFSLVTQPSIVAYSDKVHGFEPNAYGKPVYTKDVWMSQS